MLVHYFCLYFRSYLLSLLYFLFHFLLYLSSNALDPIFSLNFLFASLYSFNFILFSRVLSYFSHASAAAASMSELIYLGLY